MKNNKGFTLIEIIFSVAFLSIVSVIMLQLLTASHEIEKQTDIVEVATLHAMNEIEIIKNLTALPSDLEKIISYDEKWQESEDETFVLKRTLIKDDSYDRLYFIKVTVSNDDEIIVDIETKHFFVDKE